jgi:Cell Wall Hydrolase
MHRYAMGLLVAGCLLAVPASAAYLPQQETRIVVNDLFERDVVSEIDHYCMTLAIFFEGGSTGESDTGMRHIARVIAERAKANRPQWGGPTICGVVFYQKTTTCQFSFACLPLARRTPRPGPGWDASAQIAREQMEGRNADTPDLIRYYMNAPLSKARNACNFRKEFVRVTTAGRHEFFREATTAERRELAQQDHEDCRRYTDSLKKSKAKSKKFAKHQKSKKYAKLNSKKKKKYASKSARRG